jgi:LCP family protein required for cell wall assembly
MRTTLKRGIGRGGVLGGNGHSILPPSVLTPMARYRQPDPPKRSTPRLIGRILIWLVTMVLVVVVGGVAGIYLWLHESVAAVQAHSADTKAAQKLLGEPPPPGHASIALVIGYDRRAGESTGTPSRSDTVMLLRADPATKTIAMMSFPRDLVVPIYCPDQAPFVGKINSAYATCGSKGTLQTVRELIDLPINYLITVNFRGFKQIVNRLGGVWIDVDRRYFNDNAGLSSSFGYAKINLRPGYQRLTGGAALDYVRYRHTDSDLYRVVRQQQFVKAMKYQFAHEFSVFSVPKIVGAITKNVEVGVGGGKSLSTKTVISYALFAYRLPSGHFFQTQIEGLSGYSDLRTDTSNIQAAVQDWLTPDVEAAKAATAVALGRKPKTTTPLPAQTSITVLNGNGIAGSAGSAGYALSQQGYEVVQPPSNATGNAPSFDYFHTTVFWNPRVKRSEAAAASVAKLFAPADVKRITSEIAPLGNGAMLTVVVGQTFKGRIAPAPPARVPAKREPARVVSNPYDTPTTLRGVRGVPFPLMVPTVIESSSAPDTTMPVRAYRVYKGRKGVRLVFRTGGGAYWGIQQTNWNDAPVLSDRSVRRNIGGRAYDLYYDGPKLHMVVLRREKATYWVVNSLLDHLSNETMIAIAKGLRPLKSK